MQGSVLFYFCNHLKATNGGMYFLRGCWYACVLHDFGSGTLQIHSAVLHIANSVTDPESPES